MEHLMYQPSERDFRAEVRAVQRQLLEVSNWSLKDRTDGVCPPVLPRILWLGHQHESSSYLQDADTEPRPMEETFVDYYGAEWNLDAPIQSPDLRYMHASLVDLDDADVVLQIAAFVQSWLYFGLLEAICERPLQVSYLVRPGEEDTSWLYTRNLPALLESWQRQLSLLGEEARESKLRDARRCAIRASSILADLLFQDGENTTSPLYLELRQKLTSIEPALSALHEAIATTVDLHFQSEVQSFGVRDRPFQRDYSKRLIQKGWCAFVIASAEIAMPVSFLRYIDATGYVPSNGGHELCTSNACRRNQIDLATYAQSHWKRRCRCRQIKPDVDEVFKILDADLIPVVQLSRNGTDFELGAVAPDEKADYIAFSHVWADGLGSCTEIGLQKCQVERLHLLAEKELTHGAWFWVDGLCVPKLEPYRGKAIQQMKATYRNATGVVVLDSNLRQISKSSSMIEIGWALFASGWMGRLWTYQEGFLPPWVDLELADGCYDLYSLIQELYKVYYNHVGNPFPFVFIRGLLSALQKTRPLDRQPRSNRSKSRKIVDTFNALTRRLTSRPDDQILVISLMLDLDIEYLMTFEGESRWKEFYLALKEIPWAIIFDRRPKMSLPGFKWAPSSWISSGKDEWLHYNDSLAQCSEEGLSVNIIVLVLHELCSSDKFVYHISIDDGLYELSRSASSSISTRPFSIIFVRYFDHETPQTRLTALSSVLTSVGVGHIDSTADDQFDYDFTKRWNIQLLARDLADPSIGANIVAGEWKEREFVFT